MRITLENFKCYTCSTFEFPDKGLILIYGKSGKGKTTILDGIVYALFGVTKNPCKHNTKWCQVTLEYSGLKIIRSHGPKSLIVYKGKEKFEADAAQSVICKEYSGGGISMSKEEFMSSSCIIQRKRNSLLSMKPAEKLRFIKSIAFNCDQEVLFLEKIKKATLEIKGKSSEAQANLKTAIKVEKESIKKFKKLKKPSKKVDINVEECEEMIKEKHLQLSTLHHSLQEVTKQHAKNISLVEHNKNLQDNIVKLQEKLEKLNKVNISLPDLKTLKISVDKSSLQNKYKDVMTRCSQTKKIIQDAREKLEILSKEKTLLEEEVDISLVKKRDLLLIEKTKQEALLQKVVSINKENKEIMAFVKKINKDLFSLLKKGKCSLSFTQLKEEFEKLLPDLVKELEMSKSLSCPKCNTLLRLEEDCLVPLESTPSDIRDTQFLQTCITDIKDIILKITTFQANKLWIKNNDNKDKHTSICNEIEELNLQLSQQSQLLEKLNIIKGEISSLDNLVNVNKALLAGKSMQAPKDFFIDENFTVEQHEKILEEYRNAQITLEKYNNIEREKKSCKEELNILLNRDISPVQDLSEDISNMNQEISRITCEIETLNQDLNIAKDNILYESVRKEAIRSKKLRTEAKAKVDQLADDLEGYYGLQDVHKEALLLSITDCISSANNAAIVYLSKMFQEESISITLSADINSGKVDTKTIFKGEEYSSFNELSTGQQQRAELCFCLGLADMFKSRLLLLDECLNNIEPELNASIFMYLREVGKNRLLLVASHEAIQGNFDEIITI